jgi:hypothetical protein
LDDGASSARGVRPQTVWAIRLRTRAISTSPLRSPPPFLNVAYPLGLSPVAELKAANPNSVFRSLTPLPTTKSRGGASSPIRPTASGAEASAKAAEPSSIRPAVMAATVPAFFSMTLSLCAVIPSLGSVAPSASRPLGGC